MMFVLFPKQIIDVFGEFAYVIRGFTIVRLLFGGFSWVWRALGRKKKKKNPNYRKLFKFFFF